MRIRKRIRIRLFTLMRSVRGYGFWFLFNADPDPDFYLMRMRIGSDFSPWCGSVFRPSFQKRIKPLKKCSNRLIFHTFWLVVCKLYAVCERIRIIIFIWCRSGFLFDADPGYQNDAYRWGSWSSTLFTACAVKKKRRGWKWTILYFLLRTLLD